jgi:hypothetical protein
MELVEILTCQVCQILYIDPVILPCMETICRKHVDEQMDSTSNEFKCYFCNENHQIPKNGFREDTKINTLIGFWHKNYPTVESLEQIEQYLNEPGELLNEDFSKLRENIEQDRKVQKAHIDSIYDNLLNELKNQEIEMKKEFNDNFNSNHSELRTILNELKRDFNAQTPKFNNIKSNEEKLFAKLSTFKNSFLETNWFVLESCPIDPNKLVRLKKICNYEEKLIQPLTEPNSEDDDDDEPDNPVQIIEQPNLEKTLFMALVDYSAQTSGELSIKKRDILFIEDLDESKEMRMATLFDRKESKSSSSSILKRPKSITDFKRGLVKTKYLINLHELENQDWYFGDIIRNKAEEYLKLQVNKPGSFLIRSSESKEHCFAMSIKKDSNEIKHYRIHLSDDLEKKVLLYSVCHANKFESIDELIKFYSAQNGGLCTKLTHPCYTSE